MAAKTINIDEPIYVDGETVECAWPDCGDIATVQTTDIAFPWLCHSHLIKLRNMVEDASEGDA